MGKKTVDRHKETDNLNTRNSFRMVKKTVKPIKAQEISAKDLPLACPRPKMALWNAHPKVYLPIGQTGQAICPYCSTEYILKNPN